MLEELAKCDLVCANCHRMRTVTMICTRCQEYVAGHAVGGADVCTCPPRFALVHEPHHVIIRDTVRDLNVFFLAESGFGPKSSDIDLAVRVVRYLNTYEG